MKKRRIFILLIITVIIGLFLIFNNKENEEYYTLFDDRIKSITSIIGKRKLQGKKTKKYKDSIIKTYKYENIKNPYKDLSKYILFLEEEANFITTKSFDLNKRKGLIELSRYSTNKEYIVIIDINYNKDSYTIKITRGKGKIVPLNNS